ncbi:MAG: ribosome maturation factor RimM [Eubacteriales bacterium]
MKKYLEAGIVRNVHGIRGDLTVECLCDSKEIFASLKKLYLPMGKDWKEYRCTRNQPFGGNMMLLHLEGIESREAAVGLKNQSLYAVREDLPAPKEGCYFIADLIGLAVIDADDGREYGKIRDVLNYGASDLYEVVDAAGKTSLIPAVPEFIREVDLEKGIYVTPIEGMFS